MKYPPKHIGLRHFDWVGIALTTGLPSLSKALIMYLARFMNADQDVAWPSRSRIEKELSISRGALNKHLDLLEAEGWITRTKGSPTTTTRYYVSFPEGLNRVVHEVNQVVHDVNHGSSPDELGVVHDVNTNRPIYNYPVEEKDKQPTAASQIRKSDPIPVAKIIDLYHERLPELPTVQKLTKTRESYIKQRWREGDLPNLEAWGNFFDHVRQSDFLMGRAQPMNGRRPFRADIEWLVRPGNFAKIAEERYHE